MEPTYQTKYDHMEVVNGTKALRPGWGRGGVPVETLQDNTWGVPSSHRRPLQPLRRDL